MELFLVDSIKQNLSSMKKLFYLFFILFVTSACSRDGAPGPQGPSGQDGFDGLDGLNGEPAQVFEYEFDFNSGNDYTEFIGYPEGATFTEGEMVLVYLLWESSEEFGDVWRLMPQAQIMEFGWVQYNYDFTQNDISIFLEADFPLANLGPVYTEGLVRVVVIPGKFVGNGRLQSDIDYTDYNAVKEAFNIPDRPLPEGYKAPQRF